MKNTKIGSYIHICAYKYLFLFCNSNFKIKFSTENEYNINRFARLLSNCGIETYNINIQGKLFVITCPKMEIQIDNLTIEQLKNIVRGAYLGSGSINNPENTYHLEISVRKKDYADIIVEGLSSFDIKSNVIEKNKDLDILTFKSGKIYI